MRFPSEWARKRAEERRKRFRENIQVDIHQGPVLPPKWKGAPDDYVEYWDNKKRSIRSCGFSPSPTSFNDQ